MKQLLQDLRTGAVHLETVATPIAGPGHVLVQTTRSLISVGTERMVAEFGRAGYLGKARQQPERLKAAIESVRTDGLASTIQAVRSKLDEPLPMGYSNVGRVIDVGHGVEGFEAGDRVVSNAGHAEVVVASTNLCTRVPDGVTDEQATFTVIGAVALHGIRLLEPALGETVVVIGLGLVGLMAVQILQVHGARVLGIDIDPARVTIARSYGVEAIEVSSGTDPVALATAFSGGQGVDAVLIAASTNSDDPIRQAAQMSRKRGRIVLTGVSGLHLKRSDFYEKELQFRVSASYGPGRYDRTYEEQGIDYPLPYVRWTAQRNFQTILDLLADGRLRVDDLISKRMRLDEAPEAYEAISSNSVIGVVFEYQQTDARQVDPSASVVEHMSARAGSGSAVGAVIGAGGFARGKLLPALKDSGVRLKWIASAHGISGAVAARKFQIEKSTTDVDAALSDPEVNFVVVATRHDTHAQLTIDALGAGKSVFVEKPLCLTREELANIRAAYERAMHHGGQRPILVVGFNRRFAPTTALLRKRLEGHREALTMVLTCNAGAIARDHWVHDPLVGGGRIIGEACHFIDLLAYVADAPVRRVLTVAPELGGERDTATINLWFADGSTGQVHYFSNGSKRFPKERLEVFSSGRVLVIDNFRRLKAHGQGPRPRKMLSRQDKGHGREVELFVRAVERGGEAPIAFESILNSTQATFAAVESMAESRIVHLDESR